MGLAYSGVGSERISLLFYAEFRMLAECTKAFFVLSVLFILRVQGEKLCLIF